MSDTELAAEILADQAQQFSAFMGVTKPEPSDIFVLVMGRTGSGKSTFISRCTGKPAVVVHGLNSCKDPFELLSQSYWVEILGDGVLLTVSQAQNL